MFAESCSQRALGSDTQRKTSSARFCESKEKGNTGNLCMTPHPTTPIFLTSWQGLNPEIVPSTFEENLELSQFKDLHEYPVATANFKAVEVYRRLVVWF